MKKKQIIFVSGSILSIGAGIFAVLVDRDKLEKYIVIPESAVGTLMIISIVLMAGGIIGLIYLVFKGWVTFAVDKAILSKVSSKYVMIQASQSDLGELHSLYEKHFGDDVPSTVTMLSWLQKYRNAFAMIYRIDSASIEKKAQTLVGSYKILLLNEAGVQGLNDGLLTGSTFKQEHIARSFKDAKACYVGDVIATTFLGKGTVLAYLNVACEPIFKRGLAIYARPLTPAGKRVMTKYGFVQIKDEKSMPEIGRMCKLNPIGGKPGSKAIKSKKSS